MERMRNSARRREKSREKGGKDSRTDRRRGKGYQDG